MAPAAFPYFFDLPPELRERVLHYACYEPGGIHVGRHAMYPSRPRPAAGGGGGGEGGDDDDDGGGRDARAAPPWYLPGPPPDAFPLTLFLVSSQFHREASAVFFGGANVFHLDATGGWRSLVGLLGPEAGLLGCARYAPSRRRIRRAALVLRRLGGWFADKVVPPLLDMALSGALRELEVRVVVGWSAAARPGPPPRRGEEDAVAARAPFQALLRLLADPHLQRRSLAVPADGHWALWCPFHGPPPGGGGGGGGGVGPAEERRVLPRVSQPGGASVVRVVDARGDGRPWEGSWLDVDVEAVLERYGGQRAELRILRIGD